MKRLLKLATLCSTLTLASCGDSQEKLVDDQIDWMEEITAVFNGVADGSLSSEDAAEQIRDLGKEGEEFMKRKAELFKDATPEDLKDLISGNAAEAAKASQEMFQAMQKAVDSGRLTEEISEAMQRIKQ